MIGVEAGGVAIVIEPVVIEVTPVWFRVMPVAPPLSACRNCVAEPVPEPKFSLVTVPSLP